MSRSALRFRAEVGGRADRIVGERLGWGRRLVARAFEEGLVNVNGRRAKKGDRVAPGDEIEIAVAALAEGARGRDALRPVPEPEAPLEVLVEDRRFVAVAKPPGAPSYPLRPGERGTVANALLARFPECAGAGADPREAGLVHRLDIGTSGVLVAARDPEAWRRLREAFREGRVEKEYLALVVGEVPQDGAISLPIAHDRADPRRVRVVADPREAARRGALPAETRWTVARRFRGFTLLSCRAVTGRMHQVRAHLAAMGWPVVGDRLYGAPTPAPGEPEVVGHFLHACRVVLPHPDTDAPVAIEAPLPSDRVRALAELTRRGSG